MDPTELATQTAMTEAFINHDPVELSVVNPSAKIPDGEGGWLTTPEQTIVVTGRLIPQSDKVVVLATSEGFRPRPDFILMTMPGSGIKRGARFQWSGMGWLIDQIHLKPSYELKGDVIQDG